jgi:hypothetical protein
MRSASCAWRPTRPTACATGQEEGWHVPDRTLRGRRHTLGGAAIAVASAAALLVALAAMPAASAEGEPIPMSPLSDLTSLSATVQLDVDGTVDGRPTTGDLHAELVTTDEGTSRIDVTGSLLGDVVAQVGGSAVKLFRPKTVSVLTVPDGTYVNLDALVDVCVKPGDNEATAILDQLSPAGLMTILTSSDVARGTLVGQESLDGVAVDHWVIDGDAFLEAARSSADPTVSRFAGVLTDAADADLYVSSEGGYPVAYRGGFSGPFEPLGFEGDLQVRIDLTGTDVEASVELPGSCDHPIPA